MTRWLRCFIPCALLLLLGLPAVASANVGTALILMGMGHLVVGNFFIGIVEGLLIARFFKVPPRRAIAVMVLANYFSAWVGVLGMSRAFGSVTGLTAYMSPFDAYADIYNATRLIWIGIGAFYVLTILLEWPWIAGAMWGSKRLFGRSLLANVAVQSISYAVLLGWFALLSNMSMVTDAKLVPAQHLGLKSDFCLYTIGADDGDVYRMESLIASQEKVFDLNSEQDRDRLFAVAGDSPDSYVIYSVFRRSGPDDETLRIGDQDAADAVPLLERSALKQRWFRDQAPFTGWKAMQSASDSGSNWEFSQGFWAAEGLRCRNVQTGERVKLAIETPFLSWLVRETIALPGDQVLFRLGRDQICVFDPESRKLALIARGRSPLVLLKLTPRETTGRN